MSELLGIPNPDGKPLAELWMGAHPGAPSRLVDGASRIPLNEFIASNPEKALGRETVARFGSALPFLFKVLSAGEPLSIQAHPNLVQAARGFDDEERRGVPIDAPERNYRDRNHKPEIICALTPFKALRGFRPPEEIAANFRNCGDSALVEAAAAATGENTPGSLKVFFSALMELPPERMNGIASALKSSPSLKADEAFALTEKLLSMYPGDPGVLAPLYLNLVTLSPGQAMYLPAGELHAYLEGTGIEIMANSDNVLRGGLTSKHVDVPELLSVLTFETGKPEILTPASSGGASNGRIAKGVYPSFAKEFSLSVITVRNPPPGREKGTVGRPASAEILICVEGSVVLAEPDGGVFLLKPGDSVFVSACAREYMLTGHGTLYSGTVGRENMD